MNKRIEKVNTLKCKVHIVLTNGAEHIISFEGSESPYQEYDKTLFKHRIRYYGVYGECTAIQHAHDYIYKFKRDGISIINNIMVKFSDVLSIKILDIEDKWVDVNLVYYSDSYV